MNAVYDLAVAGSGFAGSLMAAIARRLGFSVVFIERAQHPRVVIGESSTPLSNLLLETIARRYDLPWLVPLTKWGTWQQTHPEIACGLKRGFSFFHHEPGQKPAPGRAAAERQLLVAASPNDAVADTHWFRADFDTYLLQQAIALGTEYIDHCDVQSARRESAVWRLECTERGVPRTIRAHFLVDATGPHGLLHKLLGLHNAGLPGYPRTSALYSHFTGVGAFHGMQWYKDGHPPYPPDSAALHHVFPGGWMWVLHFNNGWTSAGVAASQATAERFRFQDKAAAWKRLLDVLPEVGMQFAAAVPLRPFTHVPELSFLSSAIAGEGWAMLPSAAGFVDPLLSTGFPLTLLGVLRLADVLQRSNVKSPELDLAQYARQTEAELIATADLIGALYANLDDFATFRALSLLYFAAASYAETARRLNKPQLAEAFLLHTHPQFGAGLRKLTARARAQLGAVDKRRLPQDILTFLQPFDVAGLTAQPDDHCYHVRAADLYAGAAKVQASHADIEDLLLRTGFTVASAGVQA